MINFWQQWFLVSFLQCVWLLKKVYNKQGSVKRVTFKNPAGINRSFHRLPPPDGLFSKGENPDINFTARCDSQGTDWSECLGEKCIKVKFCLKGLFRVWKEELNIPEQAAHMAFPLMERGILNIKECALFSKVPAGSLDPFGVQESGISWTSRNTVPYRIMKPITKGVIFFFWGGVVSFNFSKRFFLFWFKWFSSF